MKQLSPPSADRVEAFISAIDSYEPTLVKEHEDAFRVFARFVSRSIDARYLERHPPSELLPDLEQLMKASRTRPHGDITVNVTITDEAASRGILTTCMRDHRFIYSVVRLGLDSLGIKTYRSVNAIVPITRDASGDIIAVGATDAPRESLIWLEIDTETLAERRLEIENYIRGRLEAARSIVDDFPAISTLVTTMAARFENLASKRPDHRLAYEDNARLLHWLLNRHFVFLGTRYLPREGTKPVDGVCDYGIGRFNDWRGIKIQNPERDVLETGGLPPFLWIRKSHTESWAYRSGRTDHVLVQCFDAQDQAAGLLVIEGIFSYPALAEPRTSVPLLDRVIDRLYAQLKATKGTHRYRTIRNAFNSLPLEYLFALPIDDVRKLVEQVLEVDAEHRSQIHITTDPLQSIAFVFVALPRSHYSDELRSDIRRLLKTRFNASSVDDGVYAGNIDSVTFHYFLTSAKDIDEASQTALKAEIDQLARPWSERLADELTRQQGAKVGRQLHAQYNDAFPNRYREETSIARAVEDISFIETIGPQSRFDCDIYRESKDERLGVTRLRLFQTDNLLLSDILPILDNFGLIVIDQFPTTVNVPGRSENTIATFRISGVQNMSIDLTARRNRLRNAIRAVVLGAMSNDPLNRLLLRADIPWTSVVLIAAYQSYTRQIGLPYGQATVQEALLRHADIVRSLTEFFRAKFDPDIEGQSCVDVDDRRLQLVDRTRRALLAQLEGVEDLTSDQVLRTIYNLIESTVRTNFYSRDPNRDYHVVLKFDPSAISRMPEPRPFREIYVFHPQVNGLHLRGGPVARGGIRWSDRLLDFRTEVLGLMATQNLKNVLIVPRGAKGAFVLRQPSSDLSARRASADEMYKIFIGGLLEVTDNLVDGKPQTPKNVLRYDDYDHYLVVAADKGTAHLSDTANGLAAQQGFWLNDAFASGGTKGYDHKKEAITSRGAWAVVKRHFHEINMNPEKDTIRVIGIGDMSGDVFGNGLLRSQTVQLIAAFDHRNIFVDPNPDPATSYAARKKLFDTPRTSWEDYPKDAMSAGGGVFPRSVKSIKLSPEARAALGITTSEPLSGPDLVQAILRAPVDLLWNGGIGTYIKASTETHLDVGDPTNDAVRVDATEVRAKILGEGGNLGITAQGRIELGSRGIRLNADAIDNSAGVDLSDHEVNLKILFQRAKEQRGFPDTERDAWMERLRIEIGERVVQNNWLQSRMISLDEMRSKHDPARFQRALAFLADRTPFKRRDANLPGERMTHLRVQKNEGFYRSELAFLTSNAKLDLRQELGRSNFTLDDLQEYLFAYFPAALHKDFADDIRNHPLANNIARTVLTNEIIGDVGISWLPETTLMTGQSTDAILRAYFAASSLLGAKTLKQQLTQYEFQLSAAVEYQARLRVENALEAVTHWILRHPTPKPAFRQAFEQALAIWPKTMQITDPLRSQLASAGVPAEFAEVLAVLACVDDVLDVAHLAAQSGEAVSRAAAALHTVGIQTGIWHLLRTSPQGASTSELDRPARFAVRASIRTNLVRLAAGILRQERKLEAISDASRNAMATLHRELGPLETADQPLCNLVMGAERVHRCVTTMFGPNERKT